MAADLFACRGSLQVLVESADADNPISPMSKNAVESAAQPLSPGAPDPRHARRLMARAAGAARFPLAEEVERRMFERLDLVRLKPQRILDAGAGTGSGAEQLLRRYPGSRVLALDHAPEMLRQRGTGQLLSSRVRRMLRMPVVERVCADFAAMPLAGQSCQLIWSNLALAWAQAPIQAFREFHRVLDLGGLLMFSTFGPDTLKELRHAFARVDGFAHTLQFPDMHDLGDMLVGAGFGDPVMDMETFTLTYTEVQALVLDLRSSGQANSARGRRRALLGKAAWQAVRDQYELARRDGRLPATFEIVYGHAWKLQSRRTSEGHDIVQTDLLGHRAGRR